MTYTHDTAFFTTDPSPLSCYWAGFIAADGCLYKGSCRKNPALTLKLANKDKKHLEIFKKDICATNPIHQNSSTTCSITLNLNKEENLILNTIYNITERKSLSLLPPNLTHKIHVLSYIKGYIDGDGCVYVEETPKKPRSKLQLTVLGTKEFLTWMQYELSKHCNIPLKYTISAKNNIYRIKFNGYKAWLLGKDINASINRGLDRKWQKLINYSFQGRKIHDRQKHY